MWFYLYVVVPIILFLWAYHAPPANREYPRRDRVIGSLIPVGMWFFWSTFFYYYQ